MGIAVTCPNGHQFKVKDKYAGKKGLCPYCEGQVLVRIPDALSSRDFKAAVHRAAAADRAASSDIKKKRLEAVPCGRYQCGTRRTWPRFLRFR